MNRNLLELFYADEHTRETFKDFQIKVLEEMVIKDCFEQDGKDSQALARAKELVDESYKRLHTIFATKEKPKTDNPR